MVFRKKGSDDGSVTDEAAAYLSPGGSMRVFVLSFYLMIVLRSLIILGPDPSLVATVTVVDN